MEMLRMHRCKFIRAGLLGYRLRAGHSEGSEGRRSVTSHPRGGRQVVRVEARQTASVGTVGEVVRGVAQRRLGQVGRRGCKSRGRRRQERVAVVPSSTAISTQGVARRRRLRALIAVPVLLLVEGQRLHRLLLL
jgi:hypothetical protein